MGQAKKEKAYRSKASSSVGSSFSHVGDIQHCLSQAAGSEVRGGLTLLWRLKGTGLFCFVLLLFFHPYHPCFTLGVCIQLATAAFSNGSVFLRSASAFGSKILSTIFFVL